MSMGIGNGARENIKIRWVLDEGLCHSGVASGNGRNDISKLRASSHCSKCNCYIESVSQATSLILVEGGEPRVGKLSLLSIVVSVSKKRYLIG